MNNYEIRKQLIDVRDEYIEHIKSELMGPGSELPFPNAEHELISSSPISRYSIGILFPQGVTEQDNDEKEIIDEELSTEYLQAKSEEVQNFTEKKKDREFQLDETAIETLDEELCMATQFKPSSMGMTFLVKGSVDKVHCKVSFATYRRARLADCIVPYSPENAETYSVPKEFAHILSYDKINQAFRLLHATSPQELHELFESGLIPKDKYVSEKKRIYRLNDFQSHGYVREPHAIDDVEIVFGESDYADCEKTSSLDGKNVKLVALRTKVSEGISSLTVMLVNGVESKSVNAEQCIFQSRIEVLSENNDFIFVESNAGQNHEDMDDEEKSLDLLYRNKKIFATGQGTSVDWDIDARGTGRVWTDFFPIKEIPAMSFSLPENDLISDDKLSMKYLSDLSDADRETKLASMSSLVDLYSKWIGKLEKTAASLERRRYDVAINNIKECRRAAERMYAGIETLRTNDNAYSAFLLANRAMFMQRVHIQKQGDMAKENADRYPGDEEIEDWLNNLNYYKESDANCKWRPFQIAFLLMDINSIVQENGEDRSLVDLIWFPTGGGKTEAYLGLTAFTIFYRRLAHPDQADGTTVMMRYTLRLLAAQQFTRAATLICACEYIRRESKKVYPSYPLGKNPITIGLWIGGTHTPNNNLGKDSAKDHLEELRKEMRPSAIRYAKERHNKFQVLKCPWCGTKLVKDCVKKGDKWYLTGNWGYSMKNKKHFFMYCPHESCHFTKELPIQIIDEELYNTPPTLLFGTVDKFAMMAWDGRVGNFFGLSSDNRAPELIIQDELHLISGALGTMVGLYETAVDGLCGMKGIKPKVIASTATIRRAKEQCSVLYNRDVVQFPAPGLDANDSFFAKEDIIDYSKGMYGRKYVGIMPSGRTKAMTEVRTMAALLQMAYAMRLPDEVKDKLWTLTVYFNSLKELGKASTLVDDDVKDFVMRTAIRKFEKTRLILSSDELTSRVSTIELNETLDKLEKCEYSKENMDAKRYASNVLLATNMISVGIDIARLNVMLMIGQPKLTSEYIQASSRVGRSFPGVAFIQYDATKSRDRSHYERFYSYHDSFYRFVEPTGATPFSKPARERALHAVVIALLRYKESLIEDGDANKFDKEGFEKSISEIEAFITDRIRGINSRAGVEKDDIADVELEMKELIESWQNLVEEAREKQFKVYFGKRHMVKSPPENERRLLKQYNPQYNNAQGKDNAKDNAKETLTSMRNVDVSVKGEVIIWKD